MENNTQIPIYRARKINTDEFVIGDLFSGKFIITTSILNEKILSAIKHIEEDVLSCNINEDCKNEHMELKNMLTKLVYNERLEHIYEIDPSTLSIHFNDMLDSQGNKIFASLSEDGKGGDICSPDGIEVYFCVQDGCVFLKNDEWEKEISRVAYNNFKIIGIQQ